jgi:hypothetical protein
MKLGNVKLSETFIYKWRFWIGYGLIGIGLITALIFAGSFLPGGISNAEMQSVVKSNTVNIRDFWSLDVLNMPYHLLQHASIALFGVSVLSIKLPSIILAFFSVIGLIFLLKNWFKPSIGVLATLIAITTGQFLFIAQNGTPDIMYLFWPVWLILIASLIPLQHKYKKLFIIVFFIAAALSLYTPLSLYVIIVIAGAIILHPHLRYLIKQLTKIEMAMGVVVVSVLISPLVTALIKTPKLGLSLVGLPNTFPNIGANLASLGSEYLGFASPGGTTLITPFFELGSMLLIAMGVYYVWKTKSTAKSYIVILWTACLIPILIFNPTVTSITFLPLVLLLASGLNGLLSHWYGLFPKNPYARVGGLVPIVILVVVLVLSGLNRYIYGYFYDPNIVPNFSKDISLIPKGNQDLIVSTNEQPFYNVVAKFNKQITITSVPTGNNVLVSHDAKQNLTGYTLERIITNSYSNSSDRFYLYKKLGS